MAEVVMGVGSEQSGSLIVAQQSLRPNIKVNFALPGLEAIWSLGDSSSPYHRFVLLSRGDSTLVLESGESLQEITNTAEFITDSPTLAAGTVLRDTLVAQVYSKGVVLMDGRTDSSIKQDLTMTETLLLRGACGGMVSYGQVSGTETSADPRSIYRYSAPKFSSYSS
jgi:hypothetical protein